MGDQGKERLDWLRDRQSGIGGSDAAAIAGFDPYKSVWDVYDEKVLPVRDSEPTADQLRGQRLEDVAVAEFRARTGWSVRRQPMRRHPDFHWMIGNVDRQIIGHERGPGVLEVKVPRVANFYRMKEEGLHEQYVLQLQHYLAVYGYEWGAFAIFTPEYWDLIHFEVVRDDALIEKLMELEGVFWVRHVARRVRPERPLPRPVRIPKIPGEARRREDPEWLDAADDYRDREFEFSEAERDLATAHERLVGLLGEEHRICGGGVSVRRYETSGRRLWDAKAFRAAVIQAQQDGDDEALRTLDPDDDAFYYRTPPKEKVDVKVTERLPRELEAAP